MPEFKHLVQCIDGNLALARSTLIGARSKTITYDPFEAANVRLNQSTPVVVRSLLPSHAAVLGDGLQVPISHRRCRLRGVARHRARARWHDDGRLGISRHDFTVDAVSIVSTVGGERRHWAIYLIEQGADLGHVIDIAGGQRCRGDLPGVSVDGDVATCAMTAGSSCRASRAAIRRSRRASAPCCRPGGARDRSPAEGEPRPGSRPGGSKLYGLALRDQG